MQFSDKDIWEYNDPDFIEYVKKNLLDFKRGNIESELCFFYRWCNSEFKGRRGRLGKNPFLINWLRLKIKDCTNKKIYEVLDRLYDENPDLPNYIDDELNKIRRRYTEKDTVKENFHELRFQLKYRKPSWDQLEAELLDPPWEKEALNKIKRGLRKNEQKRRLIKKIIKALKEKKKLDQREIQREASLKKAKLLPLLSSLEAEGIIEWNKKEKKVLFISELPISKRRSKNNVRTCI